jgi:hypothetical protein
LSLVVVKVKSVDAHVFHGSHQAVHQALGSVVRACNLFVLHLDKGTGLDKELRNIESVALETRVDRSSQTGKGNPTNAVLTIGGDLVADGKFGGIKTIKVARKTSSSCVGHGRDVQRRKEKR